MHADPFQFSVAGPSTCQVNRVAILVSDQSCANSAVRESAVSVDRATSWQALVSR